MKMLESNAIIKFLDVNQSANNYYVIIEYAEGGTLRDLLSIQGKLK